MASKMKLSLEDLKVQSFVTTLADDETNKLKGGSNAPAICSSSCTTSITIRMDEEDRG